MTRPIDTVKVEVVDESQNPIGVLDNFTSMEIVNDITAPAEAAFELGDDGTWNSLEELIAVGKNYRVFVNNRLRLAGRIEMNDVPLATDGGVVRFTIRTKLADAQFASADPTTRIKDQSIKEFLLQLYAPLGYTEANFFFDGNAVRNLMTGKRSDGQPVTDLTPLKAEQAKVNPGETIFGAADRHLRRHGLMHWDTADGNIFVGAPYDEQGPTYDLRMFRDARSRENNVLSATRTNDFSGIPSRIGVFGVLGRRGHTKTRVKSIRIDEQVEAAGFYRPVVILAESIKTDGLAERTAKRELSSRSRSKDAWNIEVDGLSFWDGHANIPFGIDTVCQISSDITGGPLGGAYYLHRVTMRRDATNGDGTTLALLRRGIWVL